MAPVIDLFSRKVIGGALEDNMRKELTLNTLKIAIAVWQLEGGLIHHSDHGPQFCSNEYIDVLKLSWK